MISEGLVSKMIEYSRKSVMHIKHSAILIGKKGYIYAIATNEYSLSNTQPNIHAEVNVISKLLRKLDRTHYTPRRKANIIKSLTLIVVRTNNQHELRGSKPCKHCIDFIKKTNITNVIYSDDISSFTKERVSNINNEHISSCHRNIGLSQLKK